MSDHRQIEAFRAVMQTGTMTAASRVLRTSQPSVSRVISELERSIGMPLFTRRHGRVVPTDAGHRLYEMVERSFISVSSIMQFAADIRDFREAQVTVAAMPALSLDIIPQAVAAFLAVHPKARAAIHARSSRQVVTWILSREADIGIATHPFDSPGVRCDLQVEVPYVCMVNARHPLARRETITPVDLADECIISLTNSITHRHLEEAFERQGLKFRPQVTTPLSEVAARHAELGIGIAIVDPYSARSCATPSLIMRAFRPVIPFVFGIIRWDGPMENAAADVFRKNLIDILQQTAMPAFARPTFR